VHVSLVIRGTIHDMNYATVLLWRRLKLEVVSYTRTPGDIVSAEFRFGLVSKFIICPITVVCKIEYSCSEFYRQLLHGV
jgi:hypothetical protein